jgi:hypothetical protein
MEPSFLPLPSAATEAYNVNFQIGLATVNLNAI